MTHGSPLPQEEREMISSPFYWTWEKKKKNYSKNVEFLLKSWNLKIFGQNVSVQSLKFWLGNFPKGSFSPGSFVGRAIRPVSPRDALAYGNEDVPGHGASLGMRLGLGALPLREKGSIFC